MDINSIMMMVQDKLPKDPVSATALREKLEKLSDAKKDEFIKNLPMLQLKDPTFIFWVGSFILGNFGVGRFMIGDKQLGFIRLGLMIAYIVIYAIGIALQSAAVVSIGGLVGIAIAVWWVADLFLVGKKLRQQNLDKITQAL